MSRSNRRQYVSERRTRAAEATKARVLEAAKELFAAHGIDRVTVAQIADRAGVSVPTVYALYKSKEGMLRALMESSLFGKRYQDAFAKLSGVHDPVELIALTAHVSRAIYEGESNDLGLLRGASAFSHGLRNMEAEFERLRFQMQEARVRLLFERSRQAPNLTFEEARRVLWMFTSREVYRMLVIESGWSPDRYQEWLSETLVKALVSDPHE